MLNQDIDYLNMDREQSRAWSENIVNLLTEQDEGSTKQAAIGINDYLRPSNYEKSFAAQIFTPGPFVEEERTLALDHDQPVCLIEIEPDSAGAEQVDFGDMAETFYPYGKRVPMTMRLLQTQRVTKNVIELGAYRYNFRTVLTDLLSLRLAFLRDEGLMRATNRCLSGHNVPLLYTGKPNTVTTGVAFSYGQFQRALNVMRSQPNAIEPATMLYSHTMIALMKDQWRIDFAGTTVAADMFRAGQSDLTMPGENVKMISSIKQTLVPKNEFFFYGPENQTGKYIQMIEPTMLVENRGLKVSFQLYEYLGILLINQAAISKSTYNGT